MTLTVLRADARSLPIPDDSVDLIVTSPPYFGLRSYQDGGKHYDGQVGAEATPAEFVDALIEVTRECMRVLKPSGSLWVNLGDAYFSGKGAPGKTTIDAKSEARTARRLGGNPLDGPSFGVQRKSLVGIPWRYALRCIDDLGLILRAEVIWNKPNGLPESVTDRVRRSHEQWFHFTLNPRYFSAVDEIREEFSPLTSWKERGRYETAYGDGTAGRHGRNGDGLRTAPHPLGKLPGSVWTVPTEPLRVPEHLGVDHFAAFPSEFPKRIIAGWSPGGVCCECGEGRRPVADDIRHLQPGRRVAPVQAAYEANDAFGGTSYLGSETSWTITHYTCRCIDAMRSDPASVDAFTHGPPDTLPAVVLDPFGGTGTTAHVAHALGRHGISVDLSADYCRLASAPGLIDQRVRKVLGVEKAAAQVDGQGELFGGDAA